MKKFIAMVTVVVMLFSFSAQLSVGAAWKNTDGRWWYTTGSKTYYKNTWAKVGGYWYYFDKDGYMKNGWLNQGGKWYYLDGGVMVTGAMKIDGTTYYFENSGIMKTGWMKYYGYWYYFQNNGKMTMDSFFEINNKWYVFDDYGVMLTKFVQLDEEGYKHTYFGSDGAMKIGWIKYNGAWYYSTNDGLLLFNTAMVIDGKIYGFTTEGKMCTSPTNINGTQYNFGSDGVARSTWLQDGYGWYYITDKAVEATAGWMDIGGQKYYFNEQGYAVNGWVIIGNDYCYFNATDCNLEGKNFSKMAEDIFGLANKFNRIYGDIQEHRTKVDVNFPEYFVKVDDLYDRLAMDFTMILLQRDLTNDELNDAKNLVAQIQKEYDYLKDVILPAYE